MGIGEKIYLNTGKPDGFFGNLTLMGMNVGHSYIADWGMEHFGGLKPSSILDLGCGGGRNAQELLKRYPDTVLVGIDHSELSISMSKRVNRETLKIGRCRFLTEEIGHMPFHDGAFPLITAFETLSFLEEPLLCYKEIYRVLAPGGRFFIVNASDGTQVQDQKWAKQFKNYRIDTADQLEKDLALAGFSDFILSIDQKRHWLCLSAGKDAQK